MPNIKKQQVLIFNILITMLLSIICPTCCHALSSPSPLICNSAESKKIDAQIIALYAQLNKHPVTPMDSRIAYFSRQFRFKPYLLGALGEGPNADIDQAPLYRLDAFDCQSYVETVLALAFGHDLASFKSNLNKLRYEDSQISYIKRNHFDCLDWNVHNQHNHLLEDITQQMVSNKSMVLKAKAVVDKPNWYNHFSVDKVRLCDSTTANPEQRLNQLKQQASSLPKSLSTIDYIPLTELLDKSLQPNQTLLKQIPNASVVEIVRPNWDLTESIGTHLNVSHLGFAIWENNTLYFYHCSSQMGKVDKVPLASYLQEVTQHPTIKGINVQRVTG